MSWSGEIEFRSRGKCSGVEVKCSEVCGVCFVVHEIVSEWQGKVLKREENIPEWEDSVPVCVKVFRNERIVSELLD